jgi:quercetin dioxygenase-like cupin family protein
MAFLPEVQGQSEQQITHVDTKTGGPLLQSSVVKVDGIRPEGAAPGAKAYVQFNGPTEQLAALASGFVMLEPGAQPHPPHRHPEEEIMIVGGGTDEFFLDGVTTQVKTCDTIFAEANVLHGIRKYRPDTHDLLLHQADGEACFISRRLIALEAPCCCSVPFEGSVASDAAKRLVDQAATTQPRNADAELRRYDQGRPVDTSHTENGAR